MSKEFFWNETLGMNPDDKRSSLGVCYAICACVVALSSSVADAQSITILNDRPIQTLDKIELRVTGIPPRNKDRSNPRFWVTIVAEGGPVGKWGRFAWVTAEEKTVQFGSLDPGRYELRLHDHWQGRENTYQKVYDSQPFEVVRRSPGNIGIELLTELPVAMYAPIRARVDGMDTKLRYWVTLVAAGAREGKFDEYESFQNQTSGSVSFEGLKQGEYEIRVYDGRRGYAVLATRSLSVGTEISEESVVPLCPRKYYGGPDSIVCRCKGMPVSKVWGTNIYTGGSSTCLAALHSGALSDADLLGEGTALVVTQRPGQDQYQASTKNGVTSLSYGQYRSSFAVNRARVTAAPSGMGDAPGDDPPQESGEGGLDAADQANLTELLAGRWQGSVYEPRATTSRYSMTLSLEAREGRIVSGTSDYGSLNCQGALVASSMSSSTAVLKETVTSGCMDGYVEVEPMEDGSLQWRWFRRLGRKPEATARLTAVSAVDLETEELGSTAKAAVAEMLAGEWQGSVYQPRATTSRYAMTLSLEERNGSIVSGTSDYGSLNCQGTLVASSMSSTTAVLKETVTSGCMDGYVEVEPMEDGSVQWRWFRRIGREAEATATLFSAVAGDATVDQLIQIEAAFQAAVSVVEIQSAARDLLDAVVLVEDIDNAIRLLTLFEEGPMAKEAAYALFESGKQLEITVGAVLAEKLAGTFIDSRDSGTRGEKDSWKSAANIGISLASGGIPAYASAAVQEITKTYLKLSAEAQSYTAIQVGRAYRVSELIDSQPLANYDLERIRMELDHLNEAADYADAVSSIWSPYKTSAVVIRSLTPILEARMQQRFGLVPNSRSDIRSAYEAFFAAHIDCRRLSPTQSTNLRLALDKFAEDVNVAGWTKVSPPPGLQSSYNSCR